MTLPDWDEVAQEAARLMLATSPAELHGALCGWLAGGGVSAARWLADIMADPELPAPSSGDALARLHAVSMAQMEDPEFGFELLLPEGQSTVVRAEALFAWCRAFLGGFGLMLGDKLLSEADEEALSDLANLASASLEEGDEGSEDEESLAEIEEYLRMVVLLLHADCAMRAQHRQRLH